MSELVINVRPVTMILIVICLVIFVSGSVINDFLATGPLFLITNSLVHEGVIHLLLNMGICFFLAML